MCGKGVCLSASQQLLLFRDRATWGYHCVIGPSIHAAAPSQACFLSCRSLLESLRLSLVYIWCFHGAWQSAKSPVIPALPCFIPEHSVMVSFCRNSLEASGEITRKKGFFASSRSRSCLKSWVSSDPVSTVRAPDATKQMVPKELTLLASPECRASRCVSSWPADNTVEFRNLN